jgi:hypothetical protein
MLIRELTLEKYKKTDKFLHLSASDNLGTHFYTLQLFTDF